MLGCFKRLNVFEAECGVTRISPSDADVVRKLYPLLEKLGIGRCGFHAYRHGNATVWEPHGRHQPRIHQSAVPVAALQIMRPLLLEYPDDPTAIDTNDEYLFGNDLLVAPIVKDYDERRSVYLPKGVWYDSGPISGMQGH